MYEYLKWWLYTFKLGVKSFTSQKIPCQYNTTTCTEVGYFDYRNEQNIRHKWHIPINNTSTALTEKYHATIKYVIGYWLDFGYREDDVAKKMSHQPLFITCHRLDKI